MSQPYVWNATSSLGHVICSRFSLSRSYTSRTRYIARIVQQYSVLSSSLSLHAATLAACTPMDGDKGDLFAALRAAAAGVASATGTDTARAAAVHGSLAVLGLKAHNRDVYERLEARRQGTSGAKQALEKTNLQLQNLQYEKCHYEQEIQTCRDFRSAVSDSDVGLVPEEEFLRRAPPELNPADGAPADAHARMLNRLAFELAGAARRRR
jgi:hypothetical protein